MDSIHDMGGMHGMGPVVAEEAEPVFHADWEKRMFALNNAVTAVGIRNIDESRHARERMDPAKYLASSYYEIWLDGLVRILSEKGVISEEELSGAVAPRPVSSPRPAMKAEDVDALMDKGGNYLADDGKAARFNVGKVLAQPQWRCRNSKKYPSGRAYPSTSLCQGASRCDYTGLRPACFSRCKRSWKK